MKKFSAILFSVMYIGFSTGNIFSYSTCKDVVVSFFGMGHSAAKIGIGIRHCGKKNALQASEQGRGCCGNTAKLVKLDNRMERGTSPENSSKIATPFILIKEASFTPFFYKNPKKANTAYPYTKIVVNAIPLYILHCIYRF